MKKYLLFLSAIPAMFIVSPSWSADDRPLEAEGRYQRILERFDANGDGRLSAGEREVMKDSKSRTGKGGPRILGRQEMMERFDIDGDGRLSPKERIAARAAMRDSGARGGMRHRMMERFDADGDGRLSAEERDAARAAMRDTDGRNGPGVKGRHMNRHEVIKRFDVDGDGVLSEAEREAARTARVRKGPPMPVE